VSPFRQRLPLFLATLLVAAASLVVSACGDDELRKSGQEGEFIQIGPAVYQVQLTRLLNPNIRPDDVLLRGQVAPPSNETYLAVFVRIENEGKTLYKPPRDMKVVDTQGNEYLPLDANQSNFGLDFANGIPPGDQAPPANSPAAEGPNAGALVLFRIKTESAVENLPLELEIPSGPKTTSTIGLDV
jgi:hypothetical protein